MCIVSMYEWLIAFFKLLFENTEFIFYFFFIKINYEIKNYNIVQWFF